MGVGMHDIGIDEDGGAATHAMTEIALALAMGFFCVLVLALISMGSSESTSWATVSVDTLRVARSEAAAARPLDPDEILLIHHDGQFLDLQGRPIAVEALPRSARVVLAINPEQSMDTALTARARVPAETVTLTSLDAAWRAKLAEGGTQ